MVVAVAVVVLGCSCLRRTRGITKGTVIAVAPLVVVGVTVSRGVMGREVAVSVEQEAGVGVEEEAEEEVGEEGEEVCRRGSIIRIWWRRTAWLLLPYTTTLVRCGHVFVYRL